jgi:drug/metabolite transporter (DMT)-like permease
MVVTGPVEALRFPLDHADAWPTILISGLLSGAGAAVLFTMGVRLISRVRAGILGLVEPIVGTVAAAALLGQVLTPIQLLGGALVLSAAVLIQRDADEMTVARPSHMADDELPAPVVAI